MNDVDKPNSIHAMPLGIISCKLAFWLFARLTNDFDAVVTSRPVDAVLGRDAHASPLRLAFATQQRFVGLKTCFVVKVIVFVGAKL